SFISSLSLHDALPIWPLCERCAGEGRRDGGMSGAEVPLGDDGGPSLDELLDSLEAALQRLADPAAPLDQAVADYEQARRLLAAADRKSTRLNSSHVAI